MPFNSFEVAEQALKSDEPQVRNVTSGSYFPLFGRAAEAEGMISQMEFVRRVNVQAETVERYVREGKLVPEKTSPSIEQKTKP